MKLNLTAKRFGAVFLGLALCASFAAIAVNKASANDGNGNKDDKGIKAGLGVKMDLRLGAPQEAGMQSMVSIGPNGKVLVRGAKITGISNQTITATVSWNSYSYPWTVDASSASFLRHSNGGSALSELSVGDTISFSGMLDTGASNATVKAEVIKDWSVDRTDVPHLGTLQGELKAIAGTQVPTNLTVKVNNDDYQVSVAANTAILNKNWGRIDLGTLSVGDTVRFYGSVSGTEADATVVRDVSR